jgi:elongation factor P--(R)-beta-lysine ligase
MADQYARNTLKRFIRTFFESKGYLEVDTPILVKTPGTETYLRYFETQWLDYKSQKHPVWMRSSPEIHMKRLCSQGYDKVFQMAPCFRNHGELSDWHNPEFTMLEWYEKDKQFSDLISDTENLIQSSFEQVRGQLKIEHQPFTFTRLSVYEAFESFCKVKLIDHDEELPQKLEKQGIESITENDDFESAFFKALLERIEPEIAKMKAVSFYDYPPSQAALSKVEDGKAKRIETYINGVELSNGFLELLNPADNIQRIKDTNILRENLNIEVPQEDEDFYASMGLLDQSIDSMVGNALGFDRLLALILNSKDLNDSVPFNADPYTKMSL